MTDQAARPQPLTLLDWLKERQRNCEVIAHSKTGAERRGWLEDAAYFKAAIQAIVGFQPSPEKQP